MTKLHASVLSSAFALLGAATAQAQSQPADMPTTAPIAEPPKGDAASPRSTSASAPSSASRLSAQQSVALSEMSETAARAIQTKLQELGFYAGEIDGKVGPQTRRALREFYRAQAALVSEGKLLADAAATFDLSTDEIQRVRGEQHGGSVEPMRGVSPAKGVSPTQGVNPPEAVPPQPQPRSSIPGATQPPGSAPPPFMPPESAAPRRAQPPSTTTPDAQRTSGIL